MDIPQTDADIVVLAGDINVGVKGLIWAANFKQQVLYILGNHEFYGRSIMGLKREIKEHAKCYSNVHVLDNDSITIHDVTFHGCTLWTDFELYGNATLSMHYAKERISDFRRISFNDASMFTPEIAAALHQNSIQWLQSSISNSKSKKNVVVSHHLPSKHAIDSQFDGSELNPAFASDCSELFKLEIDLWIYGHNHHCNSYSIYDTKFVTNQRGYFGYEHIPDFDPFKVVEI